MFPFCGKIDDVVKSLWDNLKGLFGLIGIITFVKEIIGLKATAEESAAFFLKVIEFLEVSAPVGFWVWAIVVYLVSVYLLFRIWYDDCVGDPQGESRCVSGVVEAVREESVGLIFNADHPSIDVVIKSSYWPLLQLNAAMIKCSDAGSPILQVFYKSGRVCGAKLGAFIGGAVLGLGGIVAGAAAGAAVAAAVAAAAGCATVILCPLAIIIALLVIAAVVVAAVIVGAAAGGAIGAAVSEEDIPELDSGDAIRVGDYVSVQGPTARSHHGGPCCFHGH